MTFLKREWALLAGFRNIWSLSFASVATATFLIMRVSDRAIAYSGHWGFLPIPDGVALGIEVVLAAIALGYVMLAACSD